jgi:hypothetical protein
MSSQITWTHFFLHPMCIKHYLELVFGDVVISVFQCWNLLKIVHSVHIITNKQNNYFLHPKCIKHDLDLVFGKWLFLYFNVTTSWKLSTVIMLSWINSTAKTNTSRVHQTWLELVFGKVFISVFQCHNFLKTVHSDFAILNKQYSKKKIQSASNMIRACFWKCGYFYISMLKFAEHWPQCSYHTE